VLFHQWKQITDKNSAVKPIASKADSNTFFRKLEVIRSNGHIFLQNKIQIRYDAFFQIQQYLSFCNKICIHKTYILGNFYNRGMNTQFDSTNLGCHIILTK